MFQIFRQVKKKKKLKLNQLQRKVNLLERKFLTTHQHTLECDSLNIQNYSEVRKILQRILEILDTQEKTISDQTKIFKNLENKYLELDEKVRLLESRNV